MLLAYQPEPLVISALIGIAIAIGVPVLRSFEATRPHAIIIVLCTLLVAFLGYCLLNYRDGIPLEDDDDSED